MKKIHVIIAGLVCVSLTGCGSFGAGAGTGTGNNTNILGSILGDVLGAATDGQTIGNILTSVIGIDKPSQSYLIGPWKYAQPGVAFTSENLLAKAGGEVAATSAREKLTGTYQSLGINAANTFLQFNEDKTFSGKIAGKSISGTYTYNEKDASMTLKTIFFSLPAFAKRTSAGLSILFESKKLLQILQTVAAVSGNSTISTIGDLSKNYDGMRMGLDMSR